MRKIKFRLWDKSAKEMLYDLPYGMCLTVDERIIQHEENAEGRTPDTDHTDEYILMQFTGLKDKNEKEIFEGDFVNAICDVWGADKKDYGKRVVSWNEEELRFSLSEPWKEWYWSSQFIISGCGTPRPGWELEVLGNTHENPELMPK